MEDKKRIELAKQMILEAGKHILLSYDKTHELTEKTANDYVTEVDIAVEKTWRKRILTSFPDDALRGEEDVDVSGRSEYEWIFDPIDGTNNFIRHIPMFVVQLALRYQNKTVYSLIFDPNSQILYRAELGNGAYQDDLRRDISKRLHVNALALNRSMMTMTSTLVKDRPVLHRIVQNMQGKVADMRIWGTVALSYCHIASGQVDFYFSMKQKPWDVYPGKLLIEEAGGFVLEFDGSEWTEQSNQSLLICTPGNRSELLKVVQM